MHIPSSTYRIQISPHFGFSSVLDILPYLSDLGIGAIYASPVFRARPWSLHGYDIVDPNALNPELGTVEDFDHLMSEVNRRGLGWIQDIVPNHMAYHHDNHMLVDALRRGLDSVYYHHFDIDWDYPDETINGKLLAPFLNRPLSECLEAGEIEKVEDERGRWVRYQDRLLPLVPSSTPYIAVEELLPYQRFVLTPWKYGNWEINYRRFFNISGLICLRTEVAEVFRHIHLLVLRLLRAGKMTGLRIDHIDGLKQPAAYLERLRREAPDAYIVAEKILARGETLRPWRAEGTTGYDFLNMVNGLFCLGESEAEFDRIYSDFTGLNDPHDELLRDKKLLVMRRLLSGEINNLTRWLMEAAGSILGPGLPELDVVRRALEETIAHLPVYRTYVDAGEFPGTDRALLETAVNGARESQPDLAAGLDLVATVLTNQMPGPDQPSNESPFAEYIMRFQQYTGGVMAKGFEDTFLYVYNRLLSLNEVGGSPDKFGTTEEEFHDFNLERATAFPYTMNATSTHDTKRGEDARARINVLSEIPHEWQSRLERWSDLNEEKRKLVSGRRIPSRNDEYLLYQTLIGSYPFTEAEFEEYGERIARYLRKVTREAKVHTRDRDSGRIYEDGFVDFAARILDRSGPNPFLEDFEPFERKIAHYGLLNSLSQTLLKICSPGVPDFYQGSELWDLSLVDPDNRRSVDFGARARLLEDVLRGSQENVAEFIRDVLVKAADGKVKLFLVQRALAARRDKAYLFEKAGYQGLEAEGEHARHVVAFARTQAGSCAVCIVPRFVTSLVADGEYPLGREVWGDTRLILPAGVSRRWICTISGRHVLGTDRIMVGDALGLFPVSLLLEERK